MSRGRTPCVEEPKRNDGKKPKGEPTKKIASRGSDEGSGETTSPPCSGGKKKSMPPIRMWVGANEKVE